MMCAVNLTANVTIVHRAVELQKLYFSQMTHEVHILSV